jgi:hypothetical protein
MTDHPQVQTILDEIGFASRLALLAVLLIIACVVFGYGG